MSTPRQWGWEKQWGAQDGLCWICLKPMEREPAQGPRAVSVEHIVPLARGGGGSWRNKLLAHQACNCLRGAPFIWVPLAAFRRAAMKRIRERLLTSRVDGIDLGCSHVLARAPRRSCLGSRLATQSIGNGQRARRDNPLSFPSLIMERVARTNQFRAICDCRTTGASECGEPEGRRPTFCKMRTYDPWTAEHPPSQPDTGATQ